MVETFILPGQSHYLVILHDQLSIQLIDSLLCLLEIGIHDILPEGSSNLVLHTNVHLPKNYDRLVPILFGQIMIDKYNLRLPPPRGQRAR